MSAWEALRVTALIFGTTMVTVATISVLVILGLRWFGAWGPAILTLPVFFAATFLLVWIGR